jgi:predicted acetyltransferase
VYNPVIFNGLLMHRKKIASVGAANQVFFVVAKYTGTVPTASASEKLAARTVTHIKVLVCLRNTYAISFFRFSYMKFEKAFVAF